MIQFTVVVTTILHLISRTQEVNAFVSERHFISHNPTIRYRSIVPIVPRNPPKISHLNSLEHVKIYSSSSSSNSLSSDDSTSTTTTPQQKPMVKLQKQRRISRMEKFARLPVWPAWNGALLFLLSKILPNSMIAKLEDQFGGRVCPNFFQDTIRTSPFIMLVHHAHSFTAFDPLRMFQNKLIIQEGFPSHPHRGFITLTYCLHGGMKHRDSIGFQQSYGNEERHHGNIAQWLITGAGLLHEEMWDINYDQDGICSKQELFQLWVNVPSHSKMENPAVYLLSNNEKLQGGDDSAADGGRSKFDDNDRQSQNTIQSGYAHVPFIPNSNDDDTVETRVLVGEYIGPDGCRMSSTVPLESPMTILHVSLKPNAEWTMTNIPISFRTGIIYMRKGSIKLPLSNENEANHEIEPHYTAYLTPYGDELNIQAGEDGGDFLLLIGEPINEKIQARGSMVMNTIDEIDQAYNDYASGLMGRPWDPNLTDEEWKDHVNKFPSVYR